MKVKVMAKKRATFRMAITLAILFAGIFNLRVLDAIADEVALEAHSEPVRGKNLVMVDLTLTNKGTRALTLVSPIIENFGPQLTVQRAIITRDVSFDVMLNGKPLDRWCSSDTRCIYADGPCQLVCSRPGEEWKAVCFLNWEFPLEDAGEYSAHVILSLMSFTDQPKGEELTVQSNNFSFAIKPLDSDGLNKINLADLHAVEGKTSWDNDAAMAALSVAFSEEPSAVQRLADILGKKTYRLPSLLREALDISLERLRDRNAAISCAEGLLRNSSADLRLLGVKVIYTRGSKAEVPTLVKLLDDEDYNVRWFTCEALEKLGGFEFVIPEHCENQLEVMIAQAKKWWSEKGRLAP
jgi:hypothetical protein